jgi:hypothetical protein
MKKIVLLVLALLLVSSGLFAQSGGDGDFGRFIRENNLHRIGGYVSLGLVAATGTAGFLGLDFHPVLGYAALGSAAVSSLAGTLAYSHRIDEVWPHMLLNGIGIGAMVLNAFVLEPGSTEHRISGIVAAGSFAGAYVTIILITR